MKEITAGYMIIADGKPRRWTKYGNFYRLLFAGGSQNPWATKFATREAAKRAIGTENAALKFYGEPGPVQIRIVRLVEEVL